MDLNEMEKWLIFQAKTGAGTPEQTRDKLLSLIVSLILDTFHSGRYNKMILLLLA